MQFGGWIVPSHLGAVYATVQPPLQLTFAPQLMFAFAASLQSPVQLPLQVPSQCAGMPGVIVHIASHWPLHVPEQCAPFAPVGLPAHVPKQVPEHVPSHCTFAAVGGVHVPEQSA